jgi:hypothetical protein
MRWLFALMLMLVLVWPAPGKAENCTLNRLAPIAIDIRTAALVTKAIQQNNVQALSTLVEDGKVLITSDRAQAQILDNGDGSGLMKVKILSPVGLARGERIVAAGLGYEGWVNAGLCR